VVPEIGRRLNPPRAPWRHAATFGHCADRSADSPVAHDTDSLPCLTHHPHADTALIRVVSLGNDITAHTIGALAQARSGKNRTTRAPPHMCTSFDEYMHAFQTHRGDIAVPYRCLTQPISRCGNSAACSASGETAQVPTHRGAHLWAMACAVPD